MPALIDLTASLILASASPRRRELMESIGIRCTAQAADVDETPGLDEQPGDLVIRLAQDKAKAISQQLQLNNKSDIWILAADTTVVRAGRILNKPESEAVAFAMLKELQGAEHEVFGGVWFTNPAKEITLKQLVVTRVEFNSMSDQMINAYIATGEPMDKAGAYGAQGFGAQFIKAIHGSYTNVVGLDVALVAGWLRQEGLLD